MKIAEITTIYDFDETLYFRTKIAQRNDEIWLAVYLRSACECVSALTTKFPLKLIKYDGRKGKETDANARREKRFCESTKKAHPTANTKLYFVSFERKP